MKLVTLNLWGGRVKEKYKDFFDTYQDIDIWCFQEVFKNKEGDAYVNVKGFEPDFNLESTLAKYLNFHQSEFCQVQENSYGIASFIHKDIKIIDRGETLVARGDWWKIEDGHNRDHHRKLQWLEIEVNGKKLLIVNVHLTHRPEGKSDSDKRLNQSKIIVDFLNMFDCPKILVGDFNLLPNTESIKMIEDSGMKNLIKEHGVTSTRTELYQKPLQFADYVFVSPEIKVKEFKVLPDVVSDHAPVYLDFDL
jgi:endonuclease/exonuclease/phosphatase family metal-dependent hydrolase